MTQTASPREKPLLHPSLGSAKEEGPARGPRRRKEKIKIAGKQVIFPLTKKTTFVRFIEVTKKGIFLPSVNWFLGGGNVSYL